jgi:hypothetical protein
MGKLDDELFKTVEWVECKLEFEPGPGDVYATHEGVVDIGGVKLRCYNLNTGQRQEFFIFGGIWHG